MAQAYAATLHNARTLHERGNEWVLFLPAHSQGACFLPYRTEGGSKLGAKRYKPTCLPEILRMDTFIARLAAQS